MYASYIYLGKVLFHRLYESLQNSIKKMMHLICKYVYVKQPNYMERLI